MTESPSVAVFETLLATGGVVEFLDLHLERLAASAHRVGLAPPDADSITSAVAAATLGTRGAWRVRVTMTAGEAGSSSGLAVSACPVPPAPPSVELETATWHRNPTSAVRGCKAVGAADAIGGIAWARARRGTDALLLTPSGSIAEASAANVFVAIDGLLLTPSLASGCLAGIARRVILEVTDAGEAELSRADLLRATEVFLTSSTRAVQPVSRVDSSRYPTPGPLTSAALAAYRTAAGWPDVTR